MLYDEICPKVRRHNARPLDRALCLLTLGHISAYNMDNTILVYKCCTTGHDRDSNSLYQW
jgi:hypothetical protein